jgi:hypothetical protein
LYFKRYGLRGVLLDRGLISKNDVSGSVSDDIYSHNMKAEIVEWGEWGLRMWLKDWSF